MYFLVTAYDGTDENAPARRMEMRPRHLENIMKVKEKGSVICAGGITNDEGTPIGSYLVMEFETRALLDEYLESEPYISSGVWQNVKVENVRIAVQNDTLIG